MKITLKNENEKIILAKASVSPVPQSQTQERNQTWITREKNTHLPLRDLNCKTE